MATLKLLVDMVSGITHSEQRGVAFLRGHDDLTAGPEFDAKSDTPLGKRLRHKMGLWIVFLPDTKGKFHRFKDDKDKGKYRDCFVFIDLEEQVRIYGFTCHPKAADRRFELVLLIRWVQKKEKLTNYAELDRVLYWKSHSATQAALRDAL